MAGKYRKCRVLYGGRFNSFRRQQFKCANELNPKEGNFLDKTRPRYIPWLKVPLHEERKTERIYHNLSDIEFVYFHFLEWDYAVTDFCEQPLVLRNNGIR